MRNFLPFGVICLIMLSNCVASMEISMEQVEGLIERSSEKKLKKIFEACTLTPENKEKLLEQATTILNNKKLKQEDIRNSIYVLSEQATPCETLGVWVVFIIMAERCMLNAMGSSGPLDDESYSNLINLNLISFPVAFFCMFDTLLEYCNFFEAKKSYNKAQKVEELIKKF